MQPSESAEDDADRRETIDAVLQAPVLRQQGGRGLRLAVVLADPMVAALVPPVRLLLQRFGLLQDVGLLGLVARGFAAVVILARLGTESTAISALF